MMEFLQAITRFIKPALSVRSIIWAHQNSIPDDSKPLLILNITSDDSIGQDYSKYADDEIEKRISQRRATISANFYDGDTYTDIKMLSSHLKRGDREGILSDFNGSFSGLSNIRNLTEKNKADIYTPRHQLDFTIDYQEIISTNTPYIKTATTEGQIND